MSLTALIIGSGGREHAIAWKLEQEGVRIYATPGNPGIAAIGECIPLGAAAPEAYLDIAKSIRPDLTVVGPEAPLTAGIVDLFRSNGLPIFGPAQAAANLEASKAFAKQVMAKAKIPTARCVIGKTDITTVGALNSFPYPIVIKADGLAAGKGVVIAHTRAEAKAAAEHFRKTYGPVIVVEEFLQGEEASFIVMTDGETVIPLDASQDHKRIRDDDQGPNTGGMGAYSDGRILDSAMTDKIMNTVIHPALDYLKQNNTPFTGFLYAGLMLTPDGPKVLEFNVRLGDPEAQCLLHRIRSGFANALIAAANGSLKDTSLEWHPDPSACVVMASAGYPDNPHAGAIISGIDRATAAGAVVFHAGTKATSNGLETAGGRVLGVTASGSTLPAAIANAYAGVNQIHFDGMQFRKDVGRKGLKRW